MKLPEPSVEKWENFLGIIVLQIVGHLGMVGMGFDLLLTPPTVWL